VYSRRQNSRFVQYFIAQTSSTVLYLVMEKIKKAYK
jgi:hypothetical protein